MRKTKGFPSFIEVENSCNDKTMLTKTLKGIFVMIEYIDYSKPYQLVHT